MKVLNQSQSSFERKSLVLFSLMMLTNICNYLFQIITGRLLTVEEYALENTLLSLLTICSVPASILSPVAVNYAAKADLAHFPMSAVIRALFQFAAVILSGLFLTAVLGAERIGIFFGIPDTRYLVFIFALSAASLIHQMINSIQQGRQEFFRMGMQGLLQTLGKLILGCGLILAGWKVYGVLTGILIGMFVAILYGIKPIWGYVKEAFKPGVGLDLHDTGIREYILGAVVIQCCMVVFTNGDILLIKYYFSDMEAGIYSSAMVIGKIAMYVPSAIVATLFPTVIEMEARGEDSRKILAKAFCYGAGACIMCSAGMILCGRRIIGFLFGQKYLQSIAYLPAICFFVIPLTCVTIFMNYFLALNRIRIFAVTILTGLAGCIVLTSFFHENVIMVMMICGSILWMVFLFHLGFVLAGKKKKDVE